MDDSETVKELQSHIRLVQEEMKRHAGETSDPKCAALCETSAEVLSGLETAFAHFLARSEKAWEQ
jgi:hypothetical protein